MWQNKLLYRVRNNSLQFMQSKAENLLNPLRYHLSEAAKKRLRWLCEVYYENDNNVKKAAKNIGISREWLAKLKSKFERSGKDPRSLEPESRAPFHTQKRKRIAKEIENLILKVRDQYPCWGEKKIAKILDRDYQIKVSKNTVNRYLHKHQRINPKISERNKRAWFLKKELEKQKEISLRVKFRPPTKIKDYQPGALVEKDMKLVPKISKFKLIPGKYRLNDYFYFQQTFLDSFTRIKVSDLTKEPSSQEAETVWQEAKKTFPFPVAAMNTDSGGENEKTFASALEKDEVVHFHSRVSTPTDNPRVERSHLTDEVEFYKQGNIQQTFEAQKEALKGWDYTYNNVRPNQALGFLTPIEFYQLWKKNPIRAYEIVKKYQAYLKRQRQRLANSRRIKRKEQIENLMNFIDAKLNQKVELNSYKLELIKCELCLWG